MLDLLTDANAWAALLTLTALEIVLGIDNLVFIAILTSPLARRSRARRARSRPVARLRLPRRPAGLAELDHGADRARVHALRR